MSDDKQGRSGWAVVSQMGHVTLAGFVTETTLAGFGVLSVAIPDGDRTIEKLIPPSTLYDLTWVGESEARQVARRSPVQVIDDWTIRQEVRAKIESEERESIEQRARRLVEGDIRDKSAEERQKVLDILSDAKAVAKSAIDALPVGNIEVAVAKRLMADIATYCEESHQRVGGRVAIRSDDSGDWGDDDDDEPPL